MPLEIGTLEIFERNNAVFTFAGVLLLYFAIIKR
jgi:hypothetical protein